ncbi:hypothetical protein [Actinoplanes sp. NPDC048796]|uniref:hypothetical protein n=1 Tax=Actinoplanes sp. NPDC048796 TaxID=3155640 RepID=UPI0033CD9390
MRGLVHAALALTLVATASCTASHGPPAVRMTPWIATPASEPPTITDLGTVPVGELGAPAVADDRYLVRPADTSGRAVAIVDRRTGETVLRHRTARQRLSVTFTALYHQRAVILEEDIDGIDSMSADTSKQPDTVWIYDLSTGRRKSASQVAGAPQPSPYAAQSHVDERGRYYYLAQNHGGFSNCVGEIDLTTLRGRTVACVASPSVIFWLGSASTGVTWTETRSVNGKPCRTSRWFDGDTVRSIGPAGSCGTFDNAVLGTWRMWSAQSVESFDTKVPLTASDGTTTRDLGPMRPQNLIVCGPYAYWLVNDVDRPSRLVRWRPGSDVQDVYAADRLGDSTPDDVLLSPQGCADGHLSLGVSRVTGSGFTLRLLSVAPG